MHSSVCYFFLLAWILIIIGTIIQQHECLVQSSLWKKEGAVSNFVCPNETMRIAQVSSLSKCGELCTMEPGCTSFTYAQIMRTNCYLMAAEPSFTAGCAVATNAKHYVKVEKSISCNPYDGMYRTYMLPDGTTFSHRIVTTSVNVETARTDCESSGGFLAKLSSVIKLEMMQNLMHTCAGFGQTIYYVGGSNADAADVYASDAWTWTDEEPVNMNSTFWATGRPNVPETEHCLVIQGGSMNWKFNDETCSNSYNYICEKP